MSKKYYFKKISLFLTITLVLFLSGIFLFSKIELSGAQNDIEVLRPTNHTDYRGQTTNPELAYDSSNGTTFSTTDFSDTGNPSISFHTWQLATKSYTSLFLKYRYHADTATDDTYGVAFSTDGGSTWTDLVSPTSNGADDSTVTATLSPSQDLSQLQVKIYTSKERRPDRKNLYTRDIWTEGTYEITPTVTVGSTGSQIENMLIPSSDNYVGGAFTFTRNTGTCDVTQIVITETGTVNANQNLSNLKLYYEVSDSCDFEGTENLFGSADSFDTSEKAVVTGTMPVGTSQVCVYPVIDVGAGALEDSTLEIEISESSTEVSVTEGVVSPSTPVAISGTTTLTVAFPPATWKAPEDTPISGVNKLENIRLRLQVKNSGGETPDYDYQLEYAGKVGDFCGDDESFSAVPVTATTEPFEITDSTYVSDGDPTTARLTVPEEYSFVSGNMVEDPSNSSGILNLSFEEYTEIEFVFQATNNAVDGENYCFRASNKGTSLNEYSVYAELQVATP